MTIDISADLESFVQSEISRGNFSNGSELVEHAIRLLQRDREEAVLGVLAGLDDVVAGRFQPIGDAFEDLRRELSVPPVE